MLTCARQLRFFKIYQSSSCFSYSPLGPLNFVHAISLYSRRGVIQFWDTIQILAQITMFLTQAAMSFLQLWHLDKPETVCILSLTFYTITKSSLHFQSQHIFKTVNNLPSIISSNVWWEWQPLSAASKATDFKSC